MKKGETEKTKREKNRSKRKKIGQNGKTPFKTEKKSYFHHFGGVDTGGVGVSPAPPVASTEYICFFHHITILADSRNIPYNIKL